MHRRTRALLTILLLALAALAGPGTAGPAAAGGPTSVLLSVPGEGRLAALYYSDPEYRALEDLVGLTDPSSTTSEARSHPSAQVVTLTWLVHDVQVWRLDQVHLGAAGGPWVETRQVTDEGPVWDARAVWHRADRRLASLLAEVLPESGSAPVGEASLLDLALELDADPAPSADQAAPAPAPRSPVGWPVGWAAAGVLLGAVSAAGAMRLWQRRRTALADHPPATADQLAWP